VEIEASIHMTMVRTMMERTIRGEHTHLIQRGRLQNVQIPKMTDSKALR